MNNDRLRYRAWKHKGMYSGQMFYLRGPDLDGTVWFGLEGGDLYYNVGDVLWGDEFTPLQCTGLKDKNGKLIFEGDVLNIGELGHAEPCEIVFWEGCFCIKPEWNREGGPIPLKEYVNDIFIKCVEYVGNIYENGNLLE